MAVERLVPARASWRRRALDRATGSAPAVAQPIVVVGVYRRRNATVMAALLAQAGHGATIALWALDEVAPELADHTVGSGPGPKFALINRLLAEVVVPPDGYVAVVDDDVYFSVGDLPTLVGVAHRLGLDLCQPSHSWASIFTYPLLLGRPRTVARRTTFVEIGPLFVIGPGWRDRLLPFDDAFEMGWGLDVWWSSLASDGCRLGVVDACRMVHAQPVGTSYSKSEEIRRHEELVRQAGASSVYDLMRTVRRWRVMP